MTLLAPYTLGPLTLKNRLVMAPLTRNRATGTVPQSLMATYYAQRAGAGLIISEATQVTPLGQGYPDTPGIHSDEQVRGWARVTEAVHAAGGLIFLQLWHVGRISHSSYHGGRLPVAPSAVPLETNIMYPDFRRAPSDETPRPLHTGEIPEIVASYRQATLNARTAGFDGVEVHAANGYLIEQFLRTGTNQRTDRYGGSLENRTRFLREVTGAVVDAWEPGRVGVRLSPNNAPGSRADADPVATYRYVTEQLNGFGLAYLHGVEAEVGKTRASRLLRDSYEGTLLVTGGLTPTSGEALLQASEADLIGFGKLYIANPDLAERVAQGVPFNGWDTSTFYGGGAEGYTNYPRLQPLPAG